MKAALWFVSLFGFMVGGVYADPPPYTVTVVARGGYPYHGYNGPMCVRGRVPTMMMSPRYQHHRPSHPSGPVYSVRYWVRYETSSAPYLVYPHEGSWSGPPVVGRPRW